MNFIFFSPNYPNYCTEFCFHLKECGVNVLGISDVDYYLLNEKLQYSLTEYIKIDRLEDYDEVLRAVGYYTHKYGKIDRFESLNEHWLELDAHIRTDFNIFGTKLDFISNLKQKSKMEKFFKKSGVESIRSITKFDRAKAKKFISKIGGYPVVVKPNIGVGANMTYKIANESELEHFLHTKPPEVEFIMQEHIDGVLQTYDGLVNKDGEILFAASHEFPHSIMESVNAGNHFSYYCLKEVSGEIEEAGRKIIQTYGIRERFFHLEFFKSNRDGNIIALEVNMRPPGSWMTDAINYTYDIDIYELWANMVVNNQVEGPFVGKYYTGFASHKNHLPYAHGHEEIMQRYHHEIVHHFSIEDVQSQSRGNYAYQFRSKDFNEVKRIEAFIHAVENKVEVYA
ncbi:ATP-grasp domain-containing protein [Paenibacillus sp. CGMCC 1.16610]|uniref:ATP-grasp domain-containing protein n=1 Tax=Paenibacillus anseongense TaxID=2682845 RepID=A0ABW9UAP1_9BACL|nr:MULTISPECIES: ATP-grasp domain-containing protein [Paenibacillus]MBA2938928.1 ATP-grasp domain-containing protein [Paenibacillus sp. CGMCC 1.16610]MVQ34890.1 ATP-grasp domain-containing protein [Paenibacillus anseongense]